MALPSEKLAQSRAGDTTAWYISYWKFIDEYVREKLGDDWCLSPQNSI